MFLVTDDYQHQHLPFALGWSLLKDYRFTVRCGPEDNTVVIVASKPIFTQFIQFPIENPRPVHPRGQLNAGGIRKVVGASSHDEPAGIDLNTAFIDLIPILIILLGGHIMNFYRDRHIHIPNRADSDGAGCYR